jgi:hypothetical protein
MGDEVVLLKPVISTTSLYMLSLYKMLVKIKKKLDSVRCQFLLEDTSTKKSMH